MFLYNHQIIYGDQITKNLPLKVLLFSVAFQDYDAFDMANELDEMEKFLKLGPDEVATSNAEIKLSNGEIDANGEKLNEEESKVEDLDIQENGKDEISTSNDVTEVTPKEKSPTPAKDDDAGKCILSFIIV